MITDKELSQLLNFIDLLDLQQLIEIEKRIMIHRTVLEYLQAKKAQEKLDSQKGS